MIDFCTLYYLIYSELIVTSSHLPRFCNLTHNTTTDSVELYVDDVAKPIYLDLLNQLQDDLKEAKQITNHEPQRLLTIVYAPKEMVSKVINKHAILKTLFFNQWVHLVVIDPVSQDGYQLNQRGEWYSLESVSARAS